MECLGESPNVSTVRRVALTIFCFALLVAAPSPAAAGAASSPATSALLRGTVGAALLTPRARAALEGIEGALVYLGGRYGATAAPAAAAAPVEPAPEATQAEESDAATEDGSGGSIPPASAGTNGTYVPPEKAGAGELTARAPALQGADVNGSHATYVSGIVLPPPSAPERIKGVINAANTIVGRPYVWGGGHGSWYSAGYDCSGAVSFALSGELESWGAPGPGRWLTVYANAGHAYAVIAGFRWDTVGDARGTGPRWHPAGAVPAGFVARHPPGY
jgi:cell wall-associated NlpC family hydrolase